jgi:O-antigen/teichoic acid export membrane protein
VLARYVPAAPPEQRLALARALGRRLAHGRAAQLAAIGAVGVVGVLVAPDALPPLDTALVLLALTLNVAATLALQVGLGLGRTGAWSARYPLQNAALIAAVLVLRGSAGGTGGVLAVLVAAGVGAAFAGVVIAPIVRPPVDAVPVPDGALRFGVLQATGAALVQVTHRGGVLAVALLAGSDAETGYAALATGIALGVTYAVLQAFTVSLPHLADGSVADADAALRRLAGGLVVALAIGALLAAAALDRLVPAVFGDGYDDAVDAFGPALALVVLAPASALLVQAGALRMRPDVSAAAGAVSAATFLAVALVAVPSRGAVGATTAALAGTAAATALAGWRLPGALGTRLVLGTAAGLLAVLVVAGLG